MESVSGNKALDGLYWQKEQVKVADENDNGMLTQADFFALLTKELSFQDPTKPVDNNEMISQMTAFSTTDGVAELNEKFSEFANSMTSSQALQASSLVGQSVQVQTQEFVFEGYESESGRQALSDVKGKLITDKPASNVMIFVENTRGEIIQQVEVGNVSAGEHPFSWAGDTMSGEVAADGAYRYRIMGIVDGKNTELEARTYRKVDSVTLAGSGGIVLNLNGGGAMKLADVIEVSEG